MQFNLVVSIDVVLIVLVNMSSFKSHETSFLEMENGTETERKTGGSTKTGWETERKR